MAHNPSDAMVRLLHVAVSGVGVLLSLAVAAFGALMTRLDSETEYHWGMILLVAGGAGFLVSGGWVAWLVVDWRRHREERSSRP